MKVLIIPNIHLKGWIFDKAEKLLNNNSADIAICLMDIPDDWGMEYNIGLYRQTFDRAIAFAKEHPSTLWCYGNHDLSYPWGKLQSGYSPYAERIVIYKLNELKYNLEDASQIAIVHRIDNVLFCHGGLSKEYVKWLNADLLDADIDEVIAAINDAGIDELWNDESPLWLRPQYNRREMFRKDVYTQIVGHTPVKKITLEDGIISTDVFSTYRDGSSIGESAMIVVDSNTREFYKFLTFFSL